jgi:serine/threonine protein kinase
MDSGKRIIDERYRLDEVVGSGGMGVVWRAFDQRLERHVAVKEVRFPNTVTAEERAKLTKRALVEAQSAGQLDHPNIVPIHDVIEFEGRPYIIMRLVDGASLDQLIAADGPLDLVTAAAIGIALLGALTTAHAANIVHRDVKPQNVLIQRNGTAMLTDFSIAAAFGTGTVTGTGVLLGSPGYIAPERLTSGRVGPPGDMFGLGATLYYAVEGTGPFHTGEPLAGLFATALRPHPRPERAGPLTPIIDGLLAKEPRDRLDAPRALVMLEDIVQARRKDTRVAKAITLDHPPAGVPTRLTPVEPPPPNRPQAFQGPQGLPGPGVQGPQGDEPSEAVTQRFAVLPMPPKAGGRQASDWETRPASRPGPLTGPGALPPPGPPRGPFPPATPAPVPARRGSPGQRNVVLAGASVLVLLIAGGVVASVVANRDHSTLRTTTAGEIVPSSDASSSADSSDDSTTGGPQTTAGRQKSKSSTGTRVAPAVSPSSAAGAEVSTASLALSPGFYTGSCQSVPVRISIRVAVTRIPATVQYAVHLSNGTVTTGSESLSGSSGFSRTLSQSVSKAQSGPLTAYLTVSSPSSKTSNTSSIRINCVSTQPPPTTPPPTTAPPTTAPPTTGPPPTTVAPPTTEPPTTEPPTSSAPVVADPQSSAPATSVSPVSPANPATS